MLTTPPNGDAQAWTERISRRFGARSDPSFRFPSDLIAGSQAAVALPNHLPLEGIGEAAALATLAPLVLDAATDLGGDTFFGHMDPPTPWITWVTSFWNAALNQNLLHPGTAPVARAIEQRVVDWLAPGFGASGGQLVPGSTVANLTALWAARDLRQATEVVASVDAHISVRKAAHLLGLTYREVDVDASRRIRTDDLGDLSHAVLVLTAGTTSAGAIDALDAGQDAAWRHIDAAWAGPLRLSPRHAYLLDGIDRADSVAVSAHKWLFQPKESALVFFQDWDAAKRALSFGGAYLAAPNVGLLGSHGAAAIPLYATLLAWGRSALAERLDRCMDAAQELADLVEGSEEFVLFGPPASGVVLWRPRHTSADRLASSLTEATISTTTIDGVCWLRSVAANPMVNVPKFFHAVRQQAETL